MFVSTTGYYGDTYRFEPPVEVGQRRGSVPLPELAAIAMVGLNNPILVDMCKTQTGAMLGRIHDLNVGPQIIAQELTKTINTAGRTGVSYTVTVV